MQYRQREGERVKRRREERGERERVRESKEKRNKLTPFVADTDEGSYSINRRSAST